MATSDKTKEYHKRYYIEHKAEYAERGRRWDAANRKQRVLYTQRWRAKHLEAFKKYQSQWRADHREESVQRTLRARAKNPERFKKYQMEWREKNRLKTRQKQATPEYKAKSRQYLKEHYRKNKSKYILKSDKRRALLAGAAINLAGIEAWCSKIRAQKTFTCYWCNKRTPRKKLHFDHIVPISRGGAHSIDNLCASCAFCNLSKGKKLIEEWKKTHGGAHAI